MPTHVRYHLENIVRHSPTGKVVPLLITGTRTRPDWAVIDSSGDKGSDSTPSCVKHHSKYAIFISLEREKRRQFVPVVKSNVYRHAEAGITDRHGRYAARG